MIKKYNKENIIEQNKAFVFIDASNIWQAQKARGRFFDYEKLRNCLKRMFKATEIKFFYYTAYPAEGTRNYSLSNKHSFFTYLKKGLGFTVRKKELKRIVVHDDQVGDSVEEKGNMDVEMAIDIVHNLEKYDIALLFSGDSDFLALVSYIKNRGKKVFVFSSRNNISQELRTGGDGYFDVLKIDDDIWGKELKYRE